MAKRGRKSNAEQAAVAAGGVRQLRKIERRCEDGTWYELGSMGDLRKGDVFRMREGQILVPHPDGRHAFIARADAEIIITEGAPTWSVISDGWSEPDEEA